MIFWGHSICSNHPLNCPSAGRESMNHQLIALDLDNTLISAQSEAIDPGDAVAIESCIEKGIAVILASARPPRSMKPYWECLNLNAPSISYNGSIVWSFAADKALRSWHLGRDKLEAALDLIGEIRGLYAWLESEDQWLAERLGDLQVQVHIKRGGRLPEVGELRSWLGRPINKLIVYGQDCKEVIDPLQQLGFAVMYHLFPEIIEARVLGADKGQALMWVCQYLDIPMDRVVCIGDDVNDLSMFAVSGLSIAMGNAGGTIKEAADVVTLSVDKHGVGEALRQYVLT